MADRIVTKTRLLQEFIDNFNSSTPVAFTNRDNFFLMTSPTLTQTSKPTDDPYVRFYIMNNVSTQQSFGSVGNRRFERMGLVSYQVFIPANSSTGEGDTLCEEINNIFEGKSFDDIYCYEGSWSESGIQENGFFMFNGTIMWDSDQKK